MSYKVSQCTQIMEQLAPKSYAFEWDNVGLQLGSFQQKVNKILVTLTVTEALVTQAIKDEIDLIIAHHPLIFRPLRHIRSDVPVTKLCSELIRNHVAVYVSHTNLDQAPQGLNYWLAEDLQLSDHRVLQPFNEDNLVGLGRIGQLDPTTLGELVQHLKLLWNTQIRFVGDPLQKCKRVAVCGGSGGDLINTAWFKQADVLITGDVKYHEALEATQLGIGVIDAGHYGTEQIMVPKLAAYLQKNLPKCQILTSTQGDDPFSF